MPAYKVVTNYDNMFSDNPAYPSHSYVAVPNGLKSHQRPLPSGTRENITSSSGLQVTGKDRALFFKRPVLQMSQVMPLPHIRYTREMTMSVEDVARHDERKRLRQRQFEQLQLKRKSTPEMSTVRAKLISFKSFLGIFLPNVLINVYRIQVYLFFWYVQASTRKNLHCKSHKIQPVLWHLLQTNL